MNKYFKMTIISGMLMLSGIAQAAQAGGGAAAQPAATSPWWPSSAFVATSAVALTCLGNPNSTTAEAFLNTTFAATATLTAAAIERENPDKCKGLTNATAAIVISTSAIHNRNEAKGQSRCVIQ